MKTAVREMERGGSAPESVSFERAESRHSSEHAEARYGDQAPTQDVLAQCSARRVRNEHDADPLAGAPSPRLDRLHVRDPTTEILPHRPPPSEVQSEYRWIPTPAVAAVADGVTGISARGEELHVCKPDGGTAEAAVGEEEGRFGVRGGGHWGGECGEELQGPGGGGDVASCDVWGERCGDRGIGRGGRPLEGEGAEGHF